MSRIHDALKRAEQERATSMGTHVEPSFDQPEVQQVPMPSMQGTGNSGMPPNLGPELRDFAGSKRSDGMAP